MSDRDPLFIADGLIEPRRAPEMARLLRLLGRFEPHPKYRSKERQLWELHRILYGDSWVAINLIAEFYAEDATRRYIPLCGEVERLAQISWDAWAALVDLGMDVDDMGQPNLPPPRQRTRNNAAGNDPPAHPSAADA